MFALLAALLATGIFWDQPPETAPVLKQAGIEHIYVAPAQQQEWKQKGYEVNAFDASAFEKLLAPGVQYRMDVASATTVPWIDANGWRIQRDGPKKYFYDVPKGRASLAAAEAFVYGADAVIHPDREDLQMLAHMLVFVKQNQRPRLPVMANIGVMDDGSAATGEVLNLLARRNLLFKIVREPDPALNLNIRIGSPEYPKQEAADPYAFAQKVREQLTDEKRLIRIFGSSVVLAHLTGDHGQARLYLLNYSNRPVDGLRVRILGSYPHGDVAASGIADPKLADYNAGQEATEFTLPRMNTVAVIELRR